MQTVFRSLALSRLCLLALLIGCLWPALSSVPQLRINVAVQVGRANACQSVQALLRSYTAANVTVDCYSSSFLAREEQRCFVQNNGYDLCTLAAFRTGVYVAANQLAEMTDTILREDFERFDVFDAPLNLVRHPVGSERYFGVPYSADVLALSYQKSALAHHNKSLPISLEGLFPLLEYFAAQPEFDGAISPLICTDLTDSVCRDQALYSALLANTIVLGLGGSIWDSATYATQGHLNSQISVQNFQSLMRLISASFNHSRNIPFSLAKTNIVNSMCNAPRSTPFTFGFGVFAEIAQSTCPSAVSNLGIMAVPFSRGAGKSLTTLSVVSWGVPSSSPNIQAAKDLARFLSSFASQQSGVSWGYPIRKSIVEMPEFVLDGNGGLIKNRLVYAQSLSRAVEFSLPLSNSGRLTQIEDTALANLINRPSFTAQDIESTVNSIAAAQQAEIDRVYPCGPECPVAYERKQSLFTSLMALNCVCLFGIVLLTAALVRSRSAPVIKASAPTFLFFIVFGAALMFVSGILLAKEDPSNTDCIASNFVLRLGMIIIFLSLVIKTYRIAAIFNTKVISKVVMTNAHLLRLFAVGVLGFVVYLIIWGAVTPPKAAYFTNPRSDGLVDQWIACDLGTFRTWDLLIQFVLLLCASVMVFQVRNAPSAFHEGKYLGIGLYNWVLVTALVFLMHSMASSPEMQFLSEQLHILLNAPVILGTIFIPKFLHLNEEASVSADKSANSGSHHNSGTTQSHAPVVSPRSAKFGPSTPRSAKSLKVGHYASSKEPETASNSIQLQPRIEQRACKVESQLSLDDNPSPVANAAPIQPEGAATATCADRHEIHLQVVPGAYNSAFSVSQ